MSATNLLVFRDRSERVSGSQLLDSLRYAINHLEADRKRENVLDALLLAGELECALEDHDSPGRGPAAAITDRLSDILLEAETVALAEIANHINTLIGQPLPAIVHTSPPEGFSYYALHPADFAEACTEFAVLPSVSVIGIRSIGTTLSAIVASAFRQRRVPAIRITVRPAGHPYDRAVQFRAPEIEWLNREREKDSTFLIVDEGPGLSGSSFLATAEALVDAGIDIANIVLIGTREVDPDTLCAVNAAERWRRFRWARVPSTILRHFSQFENMSGGRWRDQLVGPGREWPASWPEMERLKFLSRDRRSLFKFDGLGRFGAQVRHRAEQLCKAGFIPRFERGNHGMTAYHFIRGRPLAPSDLSDRLLERFAEYCAFRHNEFRVADDSNGSLEEMVRFNFHQEFGCDLEIPEGILRTPSPVIVDGRMQAHEWIAFDGEQIFKCDACTHGNDHFFPGPTDIAWDLAGIIVEWSLSADAQQFLLTSFRKQSGVNVSDQVDAFSLAYAAFRMAFCKMALNGTQSKSEKPRLRNAYDNYRRSAWELSRKWELNTS